MPSPPFVPASRRRRQYPGIVPTPRRYPAANRTAIYPRIPRTRTKFAPTVTEPGVPKTAIYATDATGPAEFCKMTMTRTRTMTGMMTSTPTIPTIPISIKEKAE
jgi:hypothetical protein